MGLHGFSSWGDGGHWSRRALFLSVGRPFDCALSRKPEEERRRLEPRALVALAAASVERVKRRPKVDTEKCVGVAEVPRAFEQLDVNDESAGKCDQQDGPRRQWVPVEERPIHHAPCASWMVAACTPRLSSARMKSSGWVCACQSAARTPS